MGTNKAILLGYLGRDPELKQTASGLPVCNINLATQERRKDKDGNWEDRTEWHRVVVFGRNAENCSQYLQKGSQVYVEGRIETDKWQDNEGKDRYTTSIIAYSVQFLGRKGLQDANEFAEGASAQEISAVSKFLKPADEMNRVDQAAD